MNIFEWFNGKKTIIGATILFVATFLSEIIIGKWHVTVDWMQPLIETLNWLGMAMTGLGLGHKAFKPSDSLIGGGGGDKKP